VQGFCCGNTKVRLLCLYKVWSELCLWVCLGLKKTALSFLKVVKHRDSAESSPCEPGSESHVWLPPRVCDSFMKFRRFHGGDYVECRLLANKIRVCTSQKTHYFSATDSSRLIFCRIWGLHGSDYEECRFLGYKDPVHTSQETHYISAIETSRLMLCMIRGFHGGDYEECRLLGCYVGWSL
jgi:hypothetical protein